MLFKRFKKKTADKALERMLAGAEAPSFPQLTIRILQKVRDADTPIDQVVETLQWDPELVVRILSTVNTAAYSPAAPIRDVQHAVSYIGRSQLEQIVLAIAVRRAIPAKPAPEFDSQRFWSAAALRAALGRQIADKLHPATAAESFTAGLLQDMAVPVLAHSRPDEYGPILGAWNADGPRLSELERETFGWTHAEAGGLLGKSWELPDQLIDSIFYHHRSDVTDQQLLPAMRLVALLRDSKDEHGNEAFLETGRDDYGLEPDWLLEALELAGEQAEELAKLMS